MRSKKNSTDQNRGRFLAENPDADEYRNAQLVDIGILDQAYRERDSAKRNNVFLAILTLLSMLSTTILAAKDHTEALIYREDGNASLSVMGYAGTNNTPSTAAVQHALSLWLQDVRDIPAMDPVLLARNHNDALLMVARGSDADTRLHASFTPNAQAVTDRTMRRTVTHVHVDRRTDITYDVTWSEQTTSGGGTTANTYQGSITLAAPPAAPTNPLIGESNPAGVFVSTYLLDAP